MGEYDRKRERERERQTDRQTERERVKVGRCESLENRRRKGRLLFCPSGR